MSTPSDRAERALVRHGYDVAALPRLGDGVVRQVSLLEAFASLIALSIARAEFLGALLAAQVGEHGDPRDGLVYIRRALADEGETVEVGEDVRALVRLEAEERDRAGKLIKDALRLGIQAHEAEAMRSYGASIAASLQAFTRELGLDETSPAINRAAQRAVYAARRTLGFDEGAPDVAVGPPLTEAERAAVLAGRR